MADAYLIQSDTLTEIADAIRERNSQSSTVTYTPASMATEILTLGTSLNLSSEIEISVSSGYIGISPEYVGGDSRNFVGFCGTEDYFGSSVVCLVTQPQVVLDTDNDAYYPLMESSGSIITEFDCIWIDDSVIEIYVDPNEIFDGTTFTIRCIYKNIY